MRWFQKQRHVNAEPLEANATATQKTDTQAPEADKNKAATTVASSTTAAQETQTKPNTPLKAVSYKDAAKIVAAGKITKDQHFDGLSAHDALLSHQMFLVAGYNQDVLGKTNEVAIQLEHILETRLQYHMQFPSALENIPLAQSHSTCEALDDTTATCTIPAHTALMKRGESHSIPINGSFFIVGHPPNNKPGKVSIRDVFQISVSPKAGGIKFKPLQSKDAANKMRPTLLSIPVERFVSFYLQVGDAGLEVRCVKQDNSHQVYSIAALKYPPVIEREKIVAVVFNEGVATEMKPTIEEADSDNDESADDGVGWFTKTTRAFKRLASDKACTVRESDSDWHQHPIIGVTPGRVQALYDQYQY